ncbi:hypothetical protein [Yinghuangia sp. YIM S10712]|uniref:hypothetical protein n=1 Tax=Yinghuangia sp. YIM S10712 TaxID=3436930 RepID=UPI003F538BA3
MSARRSALLAGLGLVAVAAGFGTGSPSAGAAVVTNTMQCVPPPLNGPAFTWQPQVELTVAPVKEAYAVGDVVTVTWNWKTPPRNPSSWVFWGENIAQPSGVVRLTGAQTGDVAVTGPKQNPAAWGSAPLHVAAMTGTFTVERDGRIDLAPGAYAIDSWLIGDASVCTPTGTPAVSTGITVGKPSVPGPGNPTGGPGGGTSSGGASGGTLPAPGTPTTSGPPGTPGGPNPPVASGGPQAPAAGTPGAPTTPVSGLPGTPAPTDPAAQPAGPPVPGTPEAIPAALPPASNSPAPRGPLFMTPSQEGVVLGDLAPGSGAGHVTGELKPLTVTDDRGSTLGWTLTGQIGDFVAPDGSAIPGSAFRWTPGCTAAGTGSSAVSGGLPGTARATPELLCRQNPSLGEVTGGEFRVDASVEISLPAPTTGPQPYTAQLTLTLI